MKDLKTYLTEAVEIEKANNEVIITLVRRECDLAELSEEDFIKFIQEDFNKACEEYDKLVAPLNLKNRKDHVESAVKWAEQMAAKKYKSERGRNKYIETARKNAEERVLYTYSSKQLFFDMKPDYSSNSIPDCCIIKHSSNESTLKNAYKELLKSKYFKKGTGWAFKYTAKSEEQPVASFRPYVDILLNESGRAERQRDTERLNRAIDNFYSNTNYWGD